MELKNKPDIDEEVIPLKTWGVDPTPFQKLMILKNLAGVYTNFNITAVYTKYVNERMLAFCLQKLIERDSPLYSNFYLKDGATGPLTISNCEMKPTPYVLFEDVVEYRALEGDFNSQILEELDAIVFEYNVEKPLWKLIVHLDPHGKQYFTFCCDHSLFSGTAGKYFHENLLETLAQNDGVIMPFNNILFDVTTLNDFSIIPKDIVLKHTFAKFEKKPLWASIWASIRTKILLLIPGFLKRICSHFFSTTDLKNFPPFELKASKNSIISKIGIIEVEPSKLEGLLSFCRINDLTLTPVLSMMFNVATSKVIEKVFDIHNFSLMQTAATDLKKHYSTNESTYIPRSTGISCFIKPINYTSPNDLLNPARMYKKKIIEEIETPGSFENFNPPDEGFQKIIDKNESRPVTFALSNINKINATQLGWSIEKVWFSQNIGNQAHLILNVCSNNRSGLTICISYWKNWFEAASQKGLNPHEIMESRFTEVLNDIVV